MLGRSLLLIYLQTGTPHSTYREATLGTLESNHGPTLAG